MTPAALRIVDWLGEVGPRWGLPREACRVHALLYLSGRPCMAADIAAHLQLDDDAVGVALDWLVADALIRSGTGGWTTDADPWALMTTALSARRARELGPARDVRDAWQREGSDDPLMRAQAAKLFALIDDMAALDAGARRLSPATLRRLAGAGGTAARLFGRVLGGAR